MVLEEIIVTAQRREQSLQEVPVAVTAFTGEALELANITEAQVAQYLNLTPNVSYTEDGQVGSRGISIAMRGVSNINTDESSFIQSIGVYLDEFSVASVGQGTVNPQLQDLEADRSAARPAGHLFRAQRGGRRAQPDHPQAAARVRRHRLAWDSRTFEGRQPSSPISAAWSTCRLSDNFHAARRALLRGLRRPGREHRSRRRRLRPRIHDGPGYPRAGCWTTPPPWT